MKSFAATLVLFLWCTSVSGQGSGYTLTFDGNSQYVDLGDEVGNSCRTIEMWFKLAQDVTPANNTPRTLIMRDFNNASGQNTNEFGLYFAPSGWFNQTAGQLVFLRRVGTDFILIASDNDNWQANHWYHVCGTVDPVDGMRLYVNGVQQQSTHPSTEPFGIQTGTQWDRVSIGRWGNLDIRYFEGEIDEVRLWEQHRTEQEIREKMCSSLNGNEPGLRAYWNFDSGTGNTLVDNGPNNYDGAVQNMNAANWIFSGAPIGNVSQYDYQVNLNGTSITLQTTPGDAFTVDNINSTSDGIHLYKVNSLPNVYNGVSSPISNYYGVFLTAINGTYNISYDHNSSGCSGCDEIYSRNDNADLNWVLSSSDQSNCVFNLIDESTTGYDYRAEYLINTGAGAGSGSLLGNDTTMCNGSSLILNAGSSGSTITWQDGSTDPTFIVTESGTYHVTVDLSDCEVSDSIDVQFVNAPEFEITSDSSGCGSMMLTLESTSYDFIWSTGESTSSIEVSESGTYAVTIFGPCGQVEEEVNVNLSGQPIADFLTRSYPIEFTDPQAQFVNESFGGESFEWHFGDGSISYEEHPIHEYDTSGTYLVMLIAQGENEGCADTTYRYIEVQGFCTFYVANAFTPDDDGKNDRWGAKGLSCEYTSFDLEIFDRWGQLIWWTSNPIEWWDGNHRRTSNRLKQGLYVYQFTLKKAGDFDPKIVNGTVTLYRHN